MYVRRYPIVAKFGIMHLIAVNICIAMVIVIAEINKNTTNNKSIGQEQESSDNITFYQYTNLANSGNLYQCNNKHIMCTAERESFFTHKKICQWNKMQFFSWKLFVSLDFKYIYIVTQHKQTIVANF